MRVLTISRCIYVATAGMFKMSACMLVCHSRATFGGSVYILS